MGAGFGVGMPGMGMGAGFGVGMPGMGMTGGGYIPYPSGMNGYSAYNGAGMINGGMGIGTYPYPGGTSSYWNGSGGQMGICVVGAGGPCNGGWNNGVNGGWMNNGNQWQSQWQAQWQQQQQMQMTMAQQNQGLYNRAAGNQSGDYRADVSLMNNYQNATADLMQNNVGGYNYGVYGGAPYAAANLSAAFNFNGGQNWQWSF